MPFTLVSFHAHPDDEVLYTGGTLARAAAEGHRVVVAVATNGSAGLAAPQHHRGGLAARRLAELEASAAALGCADVVRLDFADSGYRTAAPPGSFSRLPVPEAAAPLVELLRRERADALTVYDPAGGYGHPDHVQVHAVGTYAARVAGTPLVLEATVDRSRIRPLIRLVAATPGLLPEVVLADYDRNYSGPEEITHRVDVRAYADVKRRAMRAHVSQASSAGGARTLSLLLRLPRPLFRRVLGTEWFVERGRTGPVVDDVFASLR
ncbi:PIG-L deacetylase family protein [Microlunatus flavus]|uniref:N-acetylglucosaminyl deacetylase, LmbE family n=1 Tax=Microlunatus flavus TaxID=1036181 RepID=A0A1H8ZDL4_9ACTN|nr:PIG-L family deacetylase [Microlunatus flavus]SEP62496.1 N-acetylglucosaminyl deacetylase, LmbE family [Microlunatus flavus]